MTDQTTGLRFDIYERVHLAEEEPAMKSLDSIELVPLIQVNTEGEHAQLKGNLLLTGQYFSELDHETRTLEHWIPVEITLPLNRVERIEDIAVEIENFDIDLLSPRLLNVTGVLSLHGFDTVLVAREWQDENQPLLQETDEERLANKPKIIPSEEPNTDTYVGNETLTGNGTWLESLESVNGQESVWVEEKPALIENEVIQPEPIPTLVEDKNELKIGFGSKPASGQGHLMNIKHLIQSDPDAKGEAGKYYGNEEAKGELAREGVRGDELEWKRLFLGERGNDRSFQKVRLCIVQKEETIDGIAERYSMNAREIMLFNHLSNYQIAAGQVIYIPS
ncbi:MAG: LysM peptidoglycan-binding domain-containing protein [Paenibacillaceae bacterium]